MASSGYPQPGNLGGLSADLQGAIKALRAQSDTLKASKESVEGRLDALEAIKTAQATVTVTTGAPGTVALVGTPRNVSAVSIVTDAGIAARVVRFTLTEAMADTDYVVMVTRDANLTGGALAVALQVINRATTYFDVGMYLTTVNSWYHVDNATNTFSVLVSR